MWIKYAGSWDSNNVPITYKLQRWILLHFSNNSIITINKSTKKLGNNFFNFFNPCFEKKIIRINKGLVNRKDFNNGLNWLIDKLEKNEKYFYNNCLKFVENEFSPNIVSKKYIDFYEDILNENR